MGPGPRFEPESQDPQSRRMTAYPTPAWKISWKNNVNAGAGIWTLVDLRQQVLSLSPLASRAPPLMKSKDTIETIKNLNKIFYKMLRPGFEPESSARKAEMIGRTTPPEQWTKKNFKWAQWGSNPWPSGYEPDALPG